MSKNDSLTEDDDSFLNLYSTKSVTNTYNNLVEKLKSSRKQSDENAAIEKSETVSSKRDEVILDAEDGEIASAIVVESNDSDVILLDDSRDSSCDLLNDVGLRRSSRIKNQRLGISNPIRESAAAAPAEERRKRKRGKVNENKRSEKSCPPLQKPECNSICLDDDVNYEVSIKIIWKSASVRTFQLRKFQKFSKIFELFMQEENVSCDKIYLTVRERNITPNDTPDSLNLQVFDFIEGGILTCSNDAPNASEKDENYQDGRDSVTVKLQDINKQVFKFTIGKNDTFKSMMIKYAEQIEVPLNKIKFYFDGEALDHSETPNSLGLDNNEIIDVKIT